MSLFPADIIAEAEALVRDFTAAGIMVSTAESCTGGLIAGALTEIAGSSAVVDRGFVTYTNRAKMEMLGVQEGTLTRYGAVSEETARQMVHGALFRSHADIAIAVTGVAGPGGGSAEKPVGLVHLAAKSRTSGLVHRKMLYGDIGRDQVRLATVRTALAMIRQLAQA
ncbi:damage-inducible protein CinA [Rhizobium sp. Root1203]|uniref:CinA family protein n=1 Tax=Rhizobium sp. Root1203 TaxID=1736427 RepID=UPI00070895D1|nr:CinA family protein [Rhizobium sp. Root1203]KQV27973.1 damage-inducible protein CinA [Rhizobium sp. Root1203]